MNFPRVDDLSAQAQYLFTISFSNFGNTMLKYSKFMHFASHSTFVCCNLIVLENTFAEWHDYRKNSKIWDTLNNCQNCPKNRKV